MRRYYSIMIIVLIFCSYLHYQLILSLHHKSQLLKANYDIDWSSMDYELPSFEALTNGKAFSSLSFDIEISNPTNFNISIEESELYLYQFENQIAVIDISGFELESERRGASI